jgi:hypothetical protein
MNSLLFLDRDAKQLISRWENCIGLWVACCQLLKDFHAADDLPKDGVLSIEIWRSGVGDKKLTTAGIGS